MIIRYCREALQTMLKKFRTKLMFQAIQCDSIFAVNVLIRTVCQIKSIGQCEDDFTVLHIAAICQNHTILSILLDHGAEVNATEPVAGMSPLHLAVVNFREKMGIIKSLLAHGSDVNAADSNGNTPLHLAIMCENCNIALIKLLLEYGADVSKENKRGKNPFQVYNEELSKRQPLSGVNPKLLRLILPKYQHVNYGMSPLHEAGMFHRVNSIRELVRLGADVNAKDSNGYTSLYYAIVARGTNEDKESTLRTLLDLGANINQKFVVWLDNSTKRTTTALHLTIMFADHDIAKILVEHAAKLVELRSGVERRALSRRIRNLINSVNEELYKRIVSLINFEDRALVDLPDTMINAWINVRSGYESYRFCCYRELRLMVRKKMRQSTVSFFEFLNAKEQQVALYARNEKLIQAIESSKETFPIYWGLLNANFERGLERLKLVESAAVLLSDILKFADPSHVAVEIILSYCSNEDLRTLTNLS